MAGRLFLQSNLIASHGDQKRLVIFKTRTERFCHIMMTTMSALPTIFVAAIISALTPAVIAMAKAKTKKRRLLWLLALLGVALIACGAYILRFK